jgi:hypothetical protein
VRVVSMDPLTGETVLALDAAGSFDVGSFMIDPGSGRDLKSNVLSIAAETPVQPLPEPSRDVVLGLLL